MISREIHTVANNFKMLPLIRFLSSFVLLMPLHRFCAASPTNILLQNSEYSSDDFNKQNNDFIVENNDVRSQSSSDSLGRSAYINEADSDKLISNDEDANNDEVDYRNTDADADRNLISDFKNFIKNDDDTEKNNDAFSSHSNDMQSESFSQVMSEKSREQDSEVVKRHSERIHPDDVIIPGNRRHKNTQRNREENSRPPAQRSSPFNDSSNVVVLVFPSDSSPGGGQSGSKGSSSSSGYVSGTISKDLGFNSTSNVEAARLNKRRLIRGSRKAVTITKREYLKKDWCRTQPFQQVVKERGCKRKRIMNRFCYGQCNSFFIPKTSRGGKTTPQQEKGSEAFRSCAYCTPVDSEWVEVTLKCPQLDPPRKTKRVQIVKQCKCMAVNLDSVELL